MTHNMIWNIKIGKYVLAMVERIKVERSVEILSDTAEITLPATVYNKALGIESNIKRGDSVEIWFGYDFNYTDNFVGYVESISTDGGSLVIRCEDELFRYRTDLPNKELVNVSVKQILEYVHQTIKGIAVSCDYDFTYDKFVIKDATGYDVLKKVQEEAMPNIYMKSNVLHIHPQYSELFGTAVYDFAVNIEDEGTDLQYKNAEDRKLLVTVEGKDAQGKAISIEEGSTGGDKETIRLTGVTSEASMRKIAKAALERKVYTGYEGNIKGWLVPYCDAGYKALVRDADYEYKNGNYYVTSVVTEFSENGGERVVTLGKKLSDE